MIQTQRHNEQGAVSLFVVIFAALLMTIVTVGFVQLMIKDQQQATNSDLSQSARDSALAGVEDAKRLLILDQACRDGTYTGNCAAIATALTPVGGTDETSCDTLPTSGLVGQTNGETIIQKTTADTTSSVLDQAYTCVKITTNTNDYKGQLALNQSAVIPLRGVSDFDSITLSWFTKADLPDPNSPALSYGSVTTGTLPLPPVGDAWELERPSLIRTQLMQTGANFTLEDFNDGRNGGSNNNTLFLYPTATGATNLAFTADGRRSPVNEPRLADCEPTLNVAEYACSVTISLPAPNDGNVAVRNAYLHLNALYNAAHFKLELKRAGVPVKFDRVQPIVDATGRANDAFRRVQARVELKSQFTYPDAALDIDGDLCKNFTITDNDAGYSNSATCTP